MKVTKWFSQRAKKNPLKMKPRVFFFLLLTLVCMLPLLAACGQKNPPAPGEVPSAKRLVYGILQRGEYSCPDLLMGYGEADYADRFFSLYHKELSECAISDGAVAISSGMGAEEITLFRPKDAAAADELLALLRQHVEEEISVYEGYSPEDVAKLKKAEPYQEGGFVVLVVSDHSEAICGQLKAYLEKPETLPAMPVKDADSSGKLPPVDSSGTGSGETSDKTSGGADKNSGKTSDTDSSEDSGKASDTDSSKVSDKTSGTDSSEVSDKTSDTDASKDSGKTSEDKPDPYSYAYQNELPEKEAVDTDFFEDAVFVGDSRLSDFLLYTKLKTAGSFAYDSLSINVIFTKKLVKQADGSSCTIAEALRQCKFRKCYLMFGFNEVGWPYPAVFIKDYEKVISLLREINPNCTIYILNEYPVTAKHSAKNTVETNENVKAQNDRLAAMAKKNGVSLVNTAAALCDATGALPADGATDGVHGTPALCRKLLAYMLRHY